MTAQFIEIVSRHRFIDPLLAGARVLELGAVSVSGARSARALQDRGAASVVSCDRDLQALVAAAAEGGGPGLHFQQVSWDTHKDAAFDLVVAHDPSWVRGEPGLPALQRLLAPGGQLLLASRGGGPALEQLRSDGELDRNSPAYEEISAPLAAAFPSVEVVVQRAIVGFALSPLTEAAGSLVVEELSTKREAAGHILFLCGERASGMVQQKLVLSGLQPLIGEGRVDRAEAQERAAAQLIALRAELERERASAVELAIGQAADRLAARLAEWERDRVTAVEFAVEEAAARWEVERDALRAFAAAQAPPEAEADEELMRRVREAEERAEAARLHAKEAEARMRAAERRAEAAEAERARSSLAARRYQAEAEQLRRSAEGVASALAHSSSGSAGRPV